MSAVVDVVVTGWAEPTSVEIADHVPIVEEAVFADCGVGVKKVVAVDQVAVVAADSGAMLFDHGVVAAVVAQRTASGSVLG